MIQTQPGTEPIILIGPMRTGKSTVGKLLADRIGYPFISLDQIEQRYTVAAGYDEGVARHLRAEQGILASYTYRRGFFDEAVIRFLQDYPQGILELGAGHPILPDESKQARVSQALAPLRNVVLLIPHADLRTSIAILRERQGPDYLDPDPNELFLHDDRYLALAKYVVYTRGKSVEETCEEVLGCLGLA